MAEFSLSEVRQLAVESQGKLARIVARTANDVRNHEDAFRALLSQYADDESSNASGALTPRIGWQDIYFAACKLKRVRDEDDALSAALRSVDEAIRLIDDVTKGDPK